MTFILYSVHVLTCLFLVLVVLLQQGKGADLSVFGGGGTMTAFGARGATSLLHKLTVSAFVIFMITTLAIGVAQTRSSGSSVMSGFEDEPAATAPAADEDEDADSGAAALPEDEPEAPQGEQPSLAPADDAADGDAADGDATDDDATDDDATADDATADDATQPESGS